MRRVFCSYMMSLILVCLTVPGLVFSSVGEARSHGLASMAAESHAHVHDADGSHGHVEFSGIQLHHDAGNHSHDTADYRPLALTLRPLFISSSVAGEPSSPPLWTSFPLERPPKSLAS